MFLQFKGSAISDREFIYYNILSSLFSLFSDKHQIGTFLLDQLWMNPPLGFVWGEQQLFDNTNMSVYKMGNIYDIQLLWDCVSQQLSTSL